VVLQAGFARGVDDGDAEPWMHLGVKREGVLRGWRARERSHAASLDGTGNNVVSISNSDARTSTSNAPDNATANFRNVAACGSRVTRFSMFDNA
jgi:hypothetical protein